MVYTLSFRRRSFAVSIKSSWRTHLTIICLKIRRRSPSVDDLASDRGCSLFGERGAGRMVWPLSSTKRINKELIYI